MLINHFLCATDLEVNINHVGTLTRCIAGGRTNAHSQSGSGDDATFGLVFRVTMKSVSLP